MADFDAELRELDSVREHAIRAMIKIAPEYRLLAYQADWHLRGLNYHLGRIRNVYAIVAQEVGDRAAGDQSADVIIMHSPDMQDLIFEFYAFIGLARITLDQLQRFAAPAFKPKSNQLPSSITEVLKGSTNFPLYVALATSHKPLLRYLLDIRDCIVHHRTFATPDNTIAVREDFPAEKLPDFQPMWFRPVVRTFFRRVGGRKIVVNVMLPDAIYRYSAGGNRGPMLPRFDYDKVNLLTQSREFARMCTWAVVSALTPTATGDRYTFTKAGSRPEGQPVKDSPRIRPCIMTGMIAVGIDLSSQPERTAICTVEWGPTVVVHEPELGAKDSELIEAMNRADRVGIDVPLGWPESFVSAIGAYHEGQRWPKPHSDRGYTSVKPTGSFGRRYAVDRCPFPATR